MLNNLSIYSFRIKKVVCYLLIIFCFCAISFGCTHRELSASENELKIEKFEEGIIEMGIFSKDIDLGKWIRKIDFSRTDVKAQFNGLLKNDAEVKAIFEHINTLSRTNPLASLALTLNLAECTYYLKNSTVLGRVVGFGWNMDNFHNQKEDQGSLYYETITATDKIIDQDKRIYTQFKPSQNKWAGASQEMDLSLYTREKRSQKEVILGYECDVIDFTLKQNDSTAQLRKLTVYTSALFNKTINFTHPYYLDENAGILKLDLYFLEDKSPSLVMKPKLIKQRAINSAELTSRTALPLYPEMNTNWAVKTLAIMMSGWSAIN